jgi:hypothetical protein
MLRNGCSRPITYSELEQFDQPLKILDEPAPHTRLGQQVRALEQLGLEKMARAVKVCGRLGEKSHFECGRSYASKIIRAHRRFCCKWCDRHYAKRLFQEHLEYQRCLHPKGTLYRVTVRLPNGVLSAEAVREFENNVVNAVRAWFKSTKPLNWGFKSLTHYDDHGSLVVKSIIALPPDLPLPPGPLKVSSSTVTVSHGASVTAYQAMLTDILQPIVTGGHSILRAHLMAAFQKGNHFRSLGIFYGLISQARGLKRNNTKLPLSTSSSGAGFDQDKSPADPPLVICPSCGPGCHRVSVSVELIDALRDLPRLASPTFGSGWDEMEKLRGRSVF